MCDERQYVCGSDATDADIEAYDRGELVPWRIAADGTMWYRRAAAGAEYPEIRAVPADDVQAADGPMELTDAERDALLRWADDLRHAGDDLEEAGNADD
ncbi:MAG: hypothetical protein GXY58_12390 [Planctomycetaceae bacterium]|nr:hypothetical protein [Planctomycetaceae bacterium]